MGKKTKPKPISVQDIVSLYSTIDTNNIFPHDIRFSCIGREEDVIMEPYLEREGERERDREYDTPASRMLPIFTSTFPIFTSLGSWFYSLLSKLIF